MNARCPDCKEEDARESGRKRGENGGLVISFERPHCMYTWIVTF